MDFIEIQEFTRYRAALPSGEVGLTLVSGNQIEGRLLSVGSDWLSLWVDDEPFTWQRAAAGTRVVAFSDIAAMRTFASEVRAAFYNTVAAGGIGSATALISTGAWLFTDEPFSANLPAFANAIASTSVSAYGATRTAEAKRYVGGDPEAVRKELEAVRGQVAFWWASPPEIAALDPISVVPAESARAQRHSRLRLHIAAGGVVLNGVTQSYEGFYATGFERADIGVISTAPSAWFADIALGVFRRVRLGTNFVYYPKAGDDGWRDYVYGYSMAAYAEYDVIAAAIEPETLRQRLSLSAGGGLHRSLTRASLRLDVPPQASGLDPNFAEVDLERKAEQSDVGPYGRLALGYAFSSTLTALLQGSVRTQKSLAREGDRRTYAIGTASGVLYDWEAYEVILPAFDLYVGVRWSL